MFRRGGITPRNYPTTEARQLELMKHPVFGTPLEIRLDKILVTQLNTKGQRYTLFHWAVIVRYFLLLYHTVYQVIIEESSAI